ncbi:MAG: hypothetical protein AB1635_09045 [Acidobacteriota bacterium]
MKVVFFTDRFTDRDLGKTFPRILRDAGLSVECHADHFAPDTPHEEWLAETARQGWVSITHDSRIRYKPNELDAVVRHKAALLVVIGKAPYPDLARSFVATAPKILAFVEAQPRPFIAKVYRATASKASMEPAPGHVQLWYPDPRS